MDIENCIPVEAYIPLNYHDEDNKMELAIIDFLNSNITDENTLVKFIREKQKIYHISLGNTQLLYAYRLYCQKNKIDVDYNIEKLLRAKICRAYSGVMVITIFTSAYPKTGEKVEKFSCPYDCHYCPNPPHMPRSYITEEPGVARAIRNNFDPVLQFRDRARTYIVNGHPVDKIELLILGGTWSSYPEDYKDEFIRDTYYSANTFFDSNFKTNPRVRLTLKEEMKINETTQCRIIGLTIETRPDKINKLELKKLRRYGVTRVQLGVQHTDDEILEKINRRCPTRLTIKAIKLLKDAGFKVDIHIMPDLPGSNPELDLKMFEYIIYSPDIQADQWKIYPCEVTPYTKIKEWYDNGEYLPYAETMVDKEINGKIIKVNPLWELLMEVKSKVPYWVRLNRVVRDIPNSWISGGNDVCNLRQVLQVEMKKRSMVCRCIRCREVKKKKTDLSKAKLFIDQYESSDGTEYFISFEDELREVLYGFLRLRLSENSGANTFVELYDTAMIRELHVYGQVVKVNDQKDGEAQHYGFGKRLLHEAERISREAGYKRISVISGNGVKDYYRKRGFVDGQYYLIKDLDNEPLYKMPLILLYFIFIYLVFISLYF